MATKKYVAAIFDVIATNISTLIAPKKLRLRRCPVMHHMLLPTKFRSECPHLQGD